MQVLEELDAQDMLEPMLEDCFSQEVCEYWFENHPRTSGELFEEMRAHFTKTEIEIITKDLDFDL